MFNIIYTIIILTVMNSQYLMLWILNHHYKLNSFLEHHGDTISKGHHITVEYDGKWLHVNYVTIGTSKLTQHLTKSHMLLYLQP